MISFQCGGVNRSILSPSRMTAWFTLSLRERTATLQSRLTSAACIHSLILSDTTQNLRPQVRLWM